MSYTNYNTDFRSNKLVIPAGARLEGHNHAGPALWNPQATQQHFLGRILELDDGTGRKFKYMKNGSTEIANARVVAAEAVDDQQKDTLQTAYGNDSGDEVIEILCTTGNGISDHDMIGGFLFVNQTAAGALEAGDMYIVKDNVWTTGDTVLRLQLADQGGIRTAIAAGSNLTIAKNLYHDVIIKPTTLTGPMLGVTRSIIPASYYFWAQYAGPCTCIIDTGDTVVVGNHVGHIDGSGTAGSVGLVATYATDEVIGRLLVWADGADFALIDLTGLGS